MALFSFTDIRFKSPTTRMIGVNSNLTGSSEYDSKIFRYPIDIGEVDKGHYMVFHVNVQQKTQFDVSEASDRPTILQNRQENPLSSPFYSVSSLSENALKPLFENIQSKLGVESASLPLNKITRGLFDDLDISSTLDLIKEKSITGLRTIKRTTDTVALYMPDTLNFTHNQSYGEMSLSGGLMDVVGAGASISEAFKQGSSKEQIREALKNVSPFIADFGLRTLFNADIARVGVAALGFAKNPLLEVLYIKPNLRPFRFDFMFYPRSENEAIEVQKILELFRFHQAPELSVQQAGYFLIPPSEFDIKFYYNGKENPNIPKISTCVLKSIDIDYAPNGFVSYEVPGEVTPSIGKTGMPVAIRLSLEFMETEILTKESYRRRSMIGSFNDGLQDEGYTYYGGGLEDNSTYFSTDGPL